MPGSTRNLLASGLAFASYGLNVAAVPAASKTHAPSGSPTEIPTAVLQSCAASMDGQLPYATPAGFEFSGNVRKFYVAAEEVEWDYAPTGWDNWLGLPLADSPRAQAAGALKYGTKWLKALYRGYTDDTFSEYSEQPSWQGTQGPTLRGEVGDLIEIMFVNKLSDYWATMHSMGLAYTKVSEGGTYPNNTQPGQSVQLEVQNAVPPISEGISPGNCAIYKWMVQPAAGPDAGEPARVHSYHSYVDMYTDTNAGLIGPTFIYASGTMESTMANYREFSLIFMIYNEAVSWLSGANAQRLANGNSQSNGQKGYGQGGHGNGGNKGGNGQGNGQGNGGSMGGSSNGNYSVYHPQLVNLAGSNQFADAPSFHSMNGYIFANNPIFDMCLGDEAIWYVSSYGSASHVFHLHGNGFSYRGANDYAIGINDGVGKTLVQPAAGPGIWQAICHVNSHQFFGMVANYRVYSEGQCPLDPKTGGS